jgi:UDP-N-acetylmuramoyl-tripeptide--D-alanyl-D-alanine ligase
MEFQDIIFIFFAIFFILLAARHILYWSWLWQIKEYRADRMRAHFQDIGPINLFLALIGYSALRSARFPKFTPKALLLFFISFFLNAAVLLLTINYFSSFFQLDAGQSRISEILSGWIRQEALGGYRPATEFLIEPFFGAPIAVWFSVRLLNFFGGFFKKRTINQAKKKIGKFSNLTVIGVTGSYGKSTTKEILYEILSRSKKFSASGGFPIKIGETGAAGEKVLKTPANINTPIGIAKLILDDLKEEHQIFIVEMGAYKKGEIREICDIVKPKIGIIIAINEQHLALFGSVQNTIDAKFELVDSLSAEGLAILNIGDENIQKGFDARNSLKKKIAADVRLYSVGEKSDFYATNVSSGGRYVKFKLVFGQEMQDFTLNVIGTHNISNALAAIIVAKQMGIDFFETAQIFQRISQLPGIFKISIGTESSIFVEDTYNANPDGVLAALNYLKNQRGRKIVIMSSLIELGSSAHEIHKSLGKEISSVVNKLILTDDYYFADIKAGVKENKDSIVEIELGKNAQKVAKVMEQDLKSSDTVLFINRGAGKVLELLKK